MTAQELLQAGRPAEALVALQKQVRDEPASAKLRVFLFQLLAVLGDYKRALNQLNVAADMDAKNLLMAQTYRPALNCESLRSEVFAGKRTPLVFGKPQAWVGWMVEALSFDASAPNRAAELRAAALEQAPAISGAVNGQPFEWFADADPRLGPMLEAIIDGRYFWVPTACIKSLTTEPPSDLRDIVWLPASVTWTNGGSTVALIPSRYPDTENSTDGTLLLSRRTDWKPISADLSTGIGQRMFATNETDVSLFDLRSLTFDLITGAELPEEEAPHG